MKKKVHLVWHHHPDYAGLQRVAVDEDLQEQKKGHKDYHATITAFSRIFNSTYVSHVVAPSDDFFHAIRSDVLSLRELEDLLLPIKDQEMRSEKKDYKMKVGRYLSSYQT